MTKIKRYVGTKTVDARPMTRAAYNEYRGWALPADEDGDDEGFLVEYVDGGKANDSRHAGYISWSPREVFERAYKEVVAPDPDTAPCGTRLLTGHKVNPANDLLRIEVLDEPGHGGASHAYDITGGTAVPTFLRFQNGPIDEVGVNGVTHEALLEIVADRLRSFQKGPYSSRLNALALTAIEDAQNWLNRRTRERVQRGVEGTHAL